MTAAVSNRTASEPSAVRCLRNVYRHKFTAVSQSMAFRIWFLVSTSASACLDVLLLLFSRRWITQVTCSSHQWSCTRLEAQLSPRGPRDAPCQLKYGSTVVRITQTDHVIARLRSAFSKCHVLFRYPHSFVHTSLHYSQPSHSQHAMPCVLSTDFRSTNLN